MGLKKNNLILMCCMVFLSSCAAYFTPTFPDISGGSLNGQGLVVLQVPSKIDRNSRLILDDGTGVPFDRETGFVAVLKKPGKYTALRIENQFFNNAIVIQKKTTRWFDLNIEFEVYPNKVTNLGALFARDATIGKLRLNDNSSAVRKMIRSRYPELYGKLGRSNFISYRGILNQGEIDLIRKTLVGKYAYKMHALRVVDYAHVLNPVLGSDYFVGWSGLFGIMDRGGPIILPNRGWEDLIPMPSYTKIPLVQGTNKELYEVDVMGRLLPVRKPRGFEHAPAYRFSERGIVLVNEDEIALRLSEQDGWRRVKVKGIKFRFNRSFERQYSVLDFAENSKYFYIVENDFGTLMWKKVLRFDKKTLAMSIIKIPPSTARFVVSDKELVAIGYFNSIVGAKRHTRPVDGDEWSSHKLPLIGFCRYLDIEVNKKRALWAACGEDENMAGFISYDLGKTWSN